jgi:hypothetical protein
MPKYMLLLVDRPTDFASLSPDAMQRIVQEYSAWAAEMGRRGRLHGGQKLADEGGKVLRRDAGGLVTDGPFAEAKEVLGGYFIIEASSYDDAVAIARTCPHATHGTAIHVRRIDDLA